MTKIRLYLDEDTMDIALLDALRLRNVDVLSTNEAQMSSRSHKEQLKWALDNQRVIYSFNVRDFYRIHNYSIGAQMRCILRIIANKSAQEMQNQVEFLSAWGEP